MRQIPEAADYPDIGAFLARINDPGFPLATTKCDVWSSSEVDPGERSLATANLFPILT